MLIVLIKDRLKRSRLSQGFTLVEVMVAVMLLLLAMAGIVPFFLSGLSQASAIRYKSVATNIARERMEQIRQLDYREITEDPNLGSTLTDRFGDTAAYERGSSTIAFAVDYAVEEEAYEEGTLKKVTVTVGWTGPPKPSVASITTMIHQQFLGPRGSFLELIPVSPDPLGTPFPLIAGATKACYHLAQADWGLVFDNLDEPGMVARDVYMRLVLFDDQGQSLALGDAGNDFTIDNSYLRYATGPDGKVNDVWFEYNFDAGAIPDGYWVLHALVYNEYDQPGNVWRLRIRVENGPPATPDPFIATPEADNQTVVLSWQGGQERDRAYYVLERSRWDGVSGTWTEPWIRISSNLEPQAATYTDSGNVANMVDPWGGDLTQNLYQYRLWAVDMSDPGLAGPAANVQVAIPPVTTTTTLAALILRPNGPGAETKLTRYPGTGEANWQDVDDVTSDGDSTYVYRDGGWEKDLYTLTDVSGSGTISSVTVWARVRQMLPPQGTNLRLRLRTGGTTYEGPELTTGNSYADYSQTWAINPKTGVAWTWADINALEAGVKINEGGGGNNTRVTQVWVQVNAYNSPGTTTTTLAPTTTTTTVPATTTTTAALHTVYIKNTINKTYTLLIKNEAGSTVYSGSVAKRATQTISNLPVGNYQITATSSGKPTIVQSFSLAAQSGQIVLTIL